MELGDAKRPREGSEETPPAKKLRAADLVILDMLEDAEAVDRNAAAPADRDLADVMRIFEEEISASSPSACDRWPQPAVDTASEVPQPASGSTSDGEESRQSDLGYLLEASDDELGLPPAGISLVDDGDSVEDGPIEDENQGIAASGQIWGLSDEMPSSYDALDLETFESNFWPAGADEAVIFNGDLFDGPDVRAFLHSDTSEFFWQPETTSAV